MKHFILFVNDMPAVGKEDYFLYVEDNDKPRALIFSTQRWEDMEQRIFNEGCTLDGLRIETLTKRLGV